MPVRKLKLPLGVLLLEMASLSTEALKEVLVLQSKEKNRRQLGEILIEKKYITKEELDQALAIQQGYPYICVANYQIGEEVINLLPYELLKKFMMLPLERIENILVIAMLYPYIGAIEEIKKRGYEPRIFLGNVKEIKEALKKYFEKSRQ